VRVVAVITDLMDRSRLTSNMPEIEFARDPTACAGADIVVVDLARGAHVVGDVRAAAPGARIVAFGPHVDTEVASEARDLGAVVLPRSRLFRDPRAAIEELDT
jgi:hypothetical protein